MSEQTASAGGVDSGESGDGVGVAAPGGNGAGGDASGAAAEAGAAPAGGAGTASADWRDSLPDELKGSKALASVADVTDLATQFVNAQGLIGNSIRIPSENASDEDRAQFRQKLLEKVPGLAEVAADDPEAFRATMRQLGAPEAADGYAMPEFEGEGLDPVEGFNDWAHEANLTQAQFETLARRFTEAQMQQRAQGAAEHNADMEALHRDWGYAFESKVEAAIGAARLTNAPDDFIEAMRENRVPAKWVSYFATLAENFGEGDIGDGGDGEANRHELTPAEAQAQVNEIMGNKQHDYWKALPGTPEKQAAMDLVMRLRHRAMGKQGREAAATVGHDPEAELG